MISDLLLAADLIDDVSSPYGTIEEHEAGAARLAVLAAHGAHVNVASLESATAAEIHLLSEHIWRWALNEAKQVSTGGASPRLPAQEFLEGLFAAETDRIGRLLLVEAIVTHPETEAKFREFDERDEPPALDHLPDAWPRNHLIRLSEEAEGEGGRLQSEANLAEMGMVLLQIATPAALALVGATIVSLRQMGRERHPLAEIVRTSVPEGDEDLARRLGLRRGRDSFR